MEVKCFNCGSDEKSRAYLKVIQDGEEKLICVRCLPFLIHGAH